MVLLQFQMNFQHVLDHVYQQLNDVRAHPKQTANKIQQLKPAFQGRLFKNKYLTRQGIAALENLIIDLSKRQSTNSRLKWSFALHMAADEQASILGKNGLFTTEGTRGHRSLHQRIQQYAIVKGKISEVYEFGGRTPEQILQQLLIDDGLSSRKRRTTLLDPIFRYIGIGASYHQTQQCCTVIILAEEIISLVAPDGLGSFKKRVIEAGKKQLISQEKSILIDNPFRNNKISVVIEPLRHETPDNNSISRRTSGTNDKQQKMMLKNSQLIFEQTLEPTINKPYLSIKPSQKPSFHQPLKEVPQITANNISESRQNSIFNNQIIPKFSVPSENGTIQLHQQVKWSPQAALIEKKEGSVIIYEPNPNGSEYFNPSLLKSGVPSSDSRVYQTYYPNSRSEGPRLIQNSITEQREKPLIFGKSRQRIQSSGSLAQSMQESKTASIAGKKQSKCLIM